MVRIRKRRQWNCGKQFLSSGISFGSALAVVLSYVQNNSVFWAIIHGLLSWIYVIYFIIVYRVFS